MREPWSVVIVGSCCTHPSKKAELSTSATHSEVGRLRYLSRRPKVALVPPVPAPTTIQRGTGCGSSSSCDSALTAIELRSEEHTSELQSRFDLVCSLLLEKKKTQ